MFNEMRTTFIYRENENAAVFLIEPHRNVETEYFDLRYSVDG